MKRTRHFLIAVLSVNLVFTSCNDARDDDQGLRSNPNILIQISFDAETVRFSKLAEHVDASALAEDVKHYVAARGVPIITRERQSLTIYKDGNFQLVIDKLNPDQNPAREAFRQETNMGTWELHQLVFTPLAVQAYDGNGTLIFKTENPQQVYFSRLIERIKTDPYFATHANIADALFRVSAKGSNYTDKMLRPFFTSEDAKYEKQDRFLIVRQNAVALMNRWGTLFRPSAAQRIGSQTTLHHFDADASFTPEETMELLEENIESILSQRDPAAIEVVTAIDTLTNTINAEVTMTASGQVLSMTSYASADNADQSIEVTYTESFETDPISHVDLLNVESTTYSNVQITNNANQ